MYNQRQNIDLQSIMDKGSALSRPRAPTPIRKAPIRAINKQNQINPGNQWMNQIGPSKSNSNIFQEKQVFMQMPTKKPLISPVRNPFKMQIQNMFEEQKRNNKVVRQHPSHSFCANHPNKNAQFNIDIEDQCFSYCSRCAAQLASQGFEVRKIEPATVKKGEQKFQTQMNHHLGRVLPSFPQYQGNTMYELILEFLTELSEVQNQHLQNMTKLNMIDTNYTEQIDQTKYFYSELLGFIQQMRDDHLNDLIEQSRKHSQIADIEHDYLRENVEQIGNIRKDIEQNLETIVEKLNEIDLKNNLNYYKQKLQVYRHKVEEQSQFFNKVINFTSEQYQSKLARVQDFMMDVWNVDAQSSSFEPSQSNQSTSQAPMPVLNQTKPMFQERIHENLMQNHQPQPKQIIQINTQIAPQREMTRGPINIQPTSGRTQNQNNGFPNISKKASNSGTQENKSTAFRKLFEEDEDQAIAETSPQFKKI